jgi:hypothetical protein
MNRLRSLKHWDRGLESHLRHGCLCVLILFVLFCVQVATLRWAELRAGSPTDCIKRLRDLTIVQDPAKGSKVIDR